MNFTCYEVGYGLISNEPISYRFPSGKASPTGARSIFSILQGLSCVTYLRACHLELGNISLNRDALETYRSKQYPRGLVSEEGAIRVFRSDEDSLVIIYRSSYPEILIPDPVFYVILAEALNRCSVRWSESLPRFAMAANIRLDWMRMLPESQSESSFSPL